MKSISEDIDVFDMLAQAHKKWIDNVSVIDISKSDTMLLLDKLKKARIGLRTAPALKHLSSLYHAIVKQERRIALDKFKKDGGEEHDFVMPSSPVDEQFQVRFDTLNNKFTAWHVSYREKQRNALKEKKILINILRALVEKENIDFAFEEFKEIRQKWQQIDDSTGGGSNKLRSTYQVLIDRFYSRQNIYFDLKRLDFKKNLEHKLALCDQAEKLVDKERVKDAMERLHALHYEFKNIGPVPKEEREKVWLRFKKASDKLRDKREQQLAIFHKELETNKEKKEKLLEALVPFSTFTATSIGEWHEKTNAIAALKKEWDEVRYTPKKYAGKLQKSFWTAYKQFFENRKTFLKKLDSDRMENIEKKGDLLRLMLDLKDNADRDGSYRKFMELQQDWKKIGPLPRGYALEIADGFREVCNFFFERQQMHFEQQRVDSVNNFSGKSTVCEELEKASNTQKASLSVLQILVDKYNAIGTVPHEKADELEVRFNAAVKAFIDPLTDLDEREKGLKLFEIQLSALKNDPGRERKLDKWRQAVRKKIVRAEHDISVFKNNLEFFRNSKRANEMKDRLNAQLETALIHLKELKTQFKLLKSHPQ